MNNKKNKSVEAPTEFTKEIKDKWLDALKSGEFTQGYIQLEYKYEGITKHCCIGVLGCTIEGLSNDGDTELPHSPYEFLLNTVGKGKVNELWMKNDKDSGNEEYLGGYLNVIPLIEQLETQD